MIKCPIMSRRNGHIMVSCIEGGCAFWDEEKKQCCIKTMALVATDKPNGGTGNGTAQAYYIPPSSYCNTNIITNPATIPTRDYPETTVYCSAKTDPNYSFEAGV